MTFISSDAPMPFRKIELKPSSGNTIGCPHAKLTPHRRSSQNYLRPVVAYNADSFRISPKQDQVVKISRHCKTAEQQSPAPFDV